MTDLLIGTDTNTNTNIHTHNGFFSRLNAWLLHLGADRYNRLVRDTKEQLFSKLSGRILEIGPGTGANLPFYPPEVELHGVEPNPHMQTFLRDACEEHNRELQVRTNVAENLPYPDNHFDYVVSTLVLCSVDDVQQSLAEIKRVLRPGGEFIFLEHVAAGKDSWLRTFQNVITPCWRCLADGCHPNRKTGAAIEEAGFSRLNIRRCHLNLPVVGPHIYGRAQKEASF